MVQDAGVSGVELIGFGVELIGICSIHAVMVLVEVARRSIDCSVINKKK
jgi:hypothetical protein